MSTRRMAPPNPSAEPSLCYRELHGHVSSNRGPLGRRQIGTILRVGDDTLGGS
jgi:hypothetical protein